jgi:predicted site-specific integrase-resolvase
MPTVGLSEAAKLTGRNQSTIHRALKSGRLAYTIDATGERRIDLAELRRVFSDMHDASAH